MVGKYFFHFGLVNSVPYQTFKGFRKYDSDSQINIQVQRRTLLFQMRSVIKQQKTSNRKSGKHKNGDEILIKRLNEENEIGEKFEKLFGQSNETVSQLNKKK